MEGEGSVGERGEGFGTSLRPEGLADGGGGAGVERGEAPADKDEGCLSPPWLLLLVVAEVDWEDALNVVERGFVPLEPVKECGLVGPAVDELVEEFVRTFVEGENELD